MTVERDRIEAQYRLLEGFAARNRDHVIGLRHTPDWSRIEIDLHDVPLIVLAPRGPERRTEWRVAFRFDDRYPARPPLFEIGPVRPVSSHIWANRTICILQPAWFPARELWTAIVDLVAMLQGDEVVGHGAHAGDAAWLSQAANRRVLRGLIGPRTRFRLPVETEAPVRQAAPPLRCAMSQAPATAIRIAPAVAPRPGTPAIVVPRP